MFPAVFNLSRQARGLNANLTGAELQTADTIFSGFTRQSALDELRTALPQ